MGSKINFSCPVGGDIAFEWNHVSRSTADPTLRPMPLLSSQKHSSSETCGVVRGDRCFSNRSGHNTVSGTAKTNNTNKHNKTREMMLQDKDHRWRRVQETETSQKSLLGVRIVLPYAVRSENDILLWMRPSVCSR